MRKSKLKDGTPFFGVKIEHFVTKGVFAKAIATHCWVNGEEFDKKMTRTTAIDRLKGGLYHNGNSGIDTGHWEGVDEEFVKSFNDAYDAAVEWIEKNYPYLNKLP